MNVPEGKWLANRAFINEREAKCWAGRQILHYRGVSVRPVAEHFHVFTWGVPSYV